MEKVRSFKIIDRNTGRWVKENKFPFSNSGGFTYYTSNEYATSFPSEAAAIEEMKNSLYDDTRITMEVVEIPVFRVACSENKFKWENIEAKTAEGAINRYCDENIRIYDADNCGDEDMSFWTISADGEEKFWNATYSWYIERNPDWNLVDTFELVECSKSEMKAPMVADRDWLRI